MSDPFLGEIRMFGGSYAPRNWALCNGQLLFVEQNGALFSLLHNVYGGDGIVNFAVPDMRGRIPMHFGTGPELNTRFLGQRLGYEQAQVTMSHLPSHNHMMVGSRDPAVTNSPEGTVLASTAVPFYDQGTSQSDKGELSSNSIGNSGGNQLHNNIMPLLCVTFIIALVGAYPPRN